MSDTIKTEQNLRMPIINDEFILSWHDSFLPNYKEGTLWINSDIYNSISTQIKQYKEEGHYMNE